MWTQLLKLCWLNTLERFFCALCSISLFCFFFSFLFCSFLFFSFFFFSLPFVSSNGIECSLFDESFISTRSSLSCLSAEKRNFCFPFFFFFLIKDKLICLRNNIPSFAPFFLSFSFIRWFFVNSTRVRAFSFFV